MSQNITEIEFEQIEIDHEETTYFQQQATHILRKFINNYNEKLEYLRTQSYFLKHKYFIIIAIFEMVDLMLIV